MPITDRIVLFSIPELMSPITDVTLGACAEGRVILLFSGVAEPLLTAASMAFCPAWLKSCPRDKQDHPGMPFLCEGKKKYPVSSPGWRKTVNEE